MNSTEIDLKLVVVEEKEIDNRLECLKENLIFSQECLVKLKEALIFGLELPLDLLRTKYDLSSRCLELVEGIQKIKEDYKEDYDFFDFHLKISEFKKTNKKKLEKFEKDILSFEQKLKTAQSSKLSLFKYVKRKLETTFDLKTTPNAVSLPVITPSGHKWHSERKVDVSSKLNSAFFTGSYLLVRNLATFIVFSLKSLRVKGTLKLPKNCEPRKIINLEDTLFIITTNEYLYKMKMNGKSKKIKLIDKPVDFDKFGSDKLSICYERSISIYEPKHQTFVPLDTPHSYVSILRCIKGYSENYYNVYSTSAYLEKNQTIKIAKIENKQATKQIKLQNFDFENLKFMAVSGGVLYSYNQGDKQVSVFDRDLDLLYNFKVDLLPQQVVLQVCVDAEHGMHFVTFSNHLHLAIVKYNALYN